MKPLLSKSEDENCLEDIGRASLQIVHDLKNQLNGLKLYATFIRKRFEKGTPSADEVETINKLISGIDRAAEDLSLLSDYGKPLTPGRQTQVEVQKILNSAVAIHPTAASEFDFVVEAKADQLVAELDAILVTEALKSISQSVAKILKSRKKDGPLRIELSSEKNGTGRDAIIDWHTLDVFDHDPFRSFAGTAEIRMALAAKAIEAQGGSAQKINDALRVRIPLIN